MGLHSFGILLSVLLCTNTLLSSIVVASGRRLVPSEAFCTPMSKLPKLIVFDLDACLWHPEMYELDAPPQTYDAALGGTRAGGDVVRLFPGAESVLRRILLDEGGRFGDVEVGVASSTTYPAWAKVCLETLPVDPSGERMERVADIVEYREIYPGSKGGEHIPSMSRESGVAFGDILFFDDCTYGDNCGEVARECAGVTCVRTPRGLTEELFEAGLAAYAAGKRGVVR